MEFEFKNKHGNEISNEEFEAFYSLIQKGLARDEYRNFDAQKKLLKIDKYSIYFAYYNKKVVAILAYWAFSDFRFIEHFVVDESYRNNELGSNMLEKFLALKKSMCVLECEFPTSNINERRLNFYKRHGFFANDFDYYQMPLNIGDKPLKLIFMSSCKKLSFEEYEVLKNKMVCEAYKQRDVEL